MLHPWHAKQRFSRNPYFRFHPLHNAFSLIAVLILFGLMAWFVIWYPR
jgi:hypothetical protein